MIIELATEEAIVNILAKYRPIPKRGRRTLIPAVRAAKPPKPPCQCGYCDKCMDAKAMKDPQIMKGRRISGKAY
jgi:hypothetical protein